MDHSAPIRLTPITKATKTIPIRGPVCTPNPTDRMGQKWKCEGAKNEIKINKCYSHLFSGATLGLLVLSLTGGSTLGARELIGWVTTMGLERFLISHWDVNDVGESSLWQNGLVGFCLKQLNYTDKKKVFVI